MSAVPHTAGAALAAPFGDFAALIAHHALERARHAAIVHGERILDYGELDARMDAVAATLQSAGVRAQETIAICAAPSIEYLEVFFGALRAGVAVAPLATTLTADAIAAMAIDSGARLLFVDDATDAALGARTTPPRVRLEAPSLERWQSPWHPRPAPIAVRPSWPFNVIYSSGTTGEPKGIVQPHSMRWAHLQRASVYGYGPDTVNLSSTPLYSNTTLVSVLPTFALGGTLVLMEKFDAEGFLALAERHRATHAMLVPVQYRRIMASPAFGRHDLSSFRTKFSTSAPFTADLKRDVLARWPGGLVEYYGMTEGGGTCVLVAHQHPGKLHTVGQPAPGHDIRVIDEEGRELARGEAGEVVGRSPAMMTGYHNRADKTAEAEWHDAEGRRFIRTGDIGCFDADGFLELVGRRKDMIISGGFNVYPADLEAVVAAHPDVEEVAVVGVPSERWGETPVAFVIARGGRTLDAAAVLAWTNERLGKVQRLAEVLAVDELPRNAIGKVLKRELRATHVAREPRG